MREHALPARHVAEEVEGHRPVLDRERILQQVVAEHLAELRAALSDVARDVDLVVVQILRVARLGLHRDRLDVLEQLPRPGPDRLWRPRARRAIGDQLGHLVEEGLQRVHRVQVQLRPLAQALLERIGLLGERERLARRLDEEPQLGEKVVAVGKRLRISI